MRILFLTTRLPFPPLGGERLRPFYFIKYLPRDWQITLLTFVESDSENAALKNYDLGNVRIRTVKQHKYKSYAKCLLGILNHNPLEIAYYDSSEMRKVVDEELRSEKYDLIFCHLLRMATYVASYTGCKKVLDMSDAMSLRYALSWRLRRSHFRLVEWLESKRLKDYEPRISSKFDLNLVASSADKIYLEEKMGVKRLDVLENGVDLEDAGANITKMDPLKIVFFGNLRTFHNIDAVMYFYKKIYPLIKKKIKGARFCIVGANIPGCILNLKRDPSVSVFNDVAKINPFIEDACVSVAPMRIAVGIQNKIIQSMAFRVPVVTTVLGLGGISAAAGKEVLLADTPCEFADNVIKLMQDPGLRSNIVYNAFELIKNKYVWTNIIKELDNKLTVLAGE